MKYLYSIIVLAFVSCGTTNTKSDEKTFPIPSHSATQWNPSADPSKHKHGDVEVFRLISKDTIYYTRFYRTENGELHPYETTIPATATYDQMNYQWLNDSTVNFKLIDSKNSKSHTIHLMGSGAVTTVQ